MRKSIIFVLVILSISNLTLSDTTCTGSLQVTTIYPVESELFVLPLTNIIQNGNSPQFSVSTPFMTAQVVAQTKTTSFTETATIISTATGYLAPNIPSGQYATLTQTKSGYTIYTGQTNKLGQITYNQLGDEIQCSDTCYNIQYIFTNMIAIICSYQQTNETTSTTTTFQSFYFIASGSTTPQYVQTSQQINTNTIGQVRVQSFRDSSTPSSATLQLNMFIIYTNPTQTTLPNSQAFQFNLTLTQATSQIVTPLSPAIPYIYQSNSISSFFYSSQGIGLQCEDQISSQKTKFSFNPITTGGYLAMGVYEQEIRANYVVYFLAVSTATQLVTFTFNPYIDLFTTQQLFSFPTFTTVGSYQAIYLNSEFVFYTDGINDLLYPGYELSSSQFALAQTLGQQNHVVAFDTLNNFMFSVGNNGYFTMQFSEPALYLPPTQSLTQNNVVVSVQFADSSTCSITFVVQFVNSISTFSNIGVVQTLPTGPLQVLYPFNSNQTVSNLFYGYNLQYQVSATPSDNSTAPTVIVQQQYLANAPYSNSATILYAKNFVFPGQEVGFLQIVQSSTKFLTIYQCTTLSLLNQMDKSCTHLPEILLTHQIQNIDVAMSNSLDSFFTLAYQFTDSQKITLFQANNESTSGQNSISLPNNETISDFRFIANTLIIGTSDEAVLYVYTLPITNQSVPTTVQLTNPALNFYTNYDHYGCTLFVDTGVELLGFFVEDDQLFPLQNSIVYTVPAQSGNYTVGIGLVNSGVYVAIVSSTSQSVTFYPKVYLLEIQLQNFQQSISIPLSDYQITNPVICSYSNNFFYIAASETVSTTTNQVILVFQPAYSTLNSLYFALQINLTSTQLSVSSFISFDMILLLGINSNSKQVAQNYQIQHMTSILFTPTLPANGYAEQGLITVSISSPDESAKKPFKLNYLIIDDQIQIGIIEGQNLQLTTNNGTNSMTISPEQYFSGSIISYQTFCTGSCSSSSVSTLFEQISNVTAAPSNPQAFTVDKEGNGYVQTLSQLYEFKNSTFNLLSTIQGTYTSCPVLFIEANSGFMVTICNTNTQVFSIITNLTAPTNSQTAAIATLTNVVSGYYYSNGFLLLITGTPTVGYIANQFYFTITNGTELISVPTTLNLGSYTSLSFLNLSITQNPTFSYALTTISTVNNQQQLNYYQIEAEIIINGTSSSIDVTNYVTQSIEYSALISNWNIYNAELLQTTQLGYATSNSVNIVLITSEQHFMFSVNYPSVTNGTLANNTFTYNNCVFAGYGYFTPIGQASSILSTNSLIIPYLHPNQDSITFTVYSNSTCQKNIPTTIIGGQLIQGQSSLSQFQLFQNGYLFTANSNQQTQVYQTQSDVTLSYLLNLDYSGSVPSQLTFVAYNNKDQQTILFPIQAHQNKSGGVFSWLWFGPLLAGIIIIIIIIVIYCVRRSRQRRYSNDEQLLQP